MALEPARVTAVLWELMPLAARADKKAAAAYLLSALPSIQGSREQRCEPHAAL